MPAVLRAPAEPRFRGLFPDWTGLRPLRWYFAEQLLEARHGSRFPTNAEGPDEDVNIYLIGLLTGFIAGHRDPRVLAGSDPLLLPPAAALPKAARAAHYRVNGDHRLLFLGLLDRGDGRRRRRQPWGIAPDAVGARDLAAGRACYALAADLLEGRRDGSAALAAVLRKLAANFEEYVHVLAVLATRRWGLGARLGEGELAGLLRPAATEPTPPAVDPNPGMDGLLDELSAYRADPSAQRAAGLRARAAALGVDAARLGLPA